MAHIQLADGGTAIGGALLFIIIFGGILYFLPSIIAVSRGVNVGSVLVINIFLGWSLIGWVVALAMAAGSKNPSVVIHNQGNYAQPYQQPPTYHPQQSYAGHQTQQQQQQQQQQLPPARPAGWYQDPWGHAAQRYWDGADWTGNTA